MRFALLALLSGCLYGKGTIEVATPPTTADATYYLLTPEATQCTAWGVGEYDVITAGHCCDEEGTYELLSRDYRVIEGTVAEYIDDDNGPRDACRIRTSTPVNVIPLATKMPSVGDRMHYYGYPKGSWIHSKGEYRGDVDGPLSDWNDHQTTAPCDRGASGSAMLNEADEAWGILVRLHFTGDRVYPGSFGCVASPLELILEVLE